MSKSGNIALSCQRPTYGVCMVANDTILDIYRSVPSGANAFDVRGTSLVDITVLYNPTLFHYEKGDNWPLNKGVKVIISTSSPSKELNDSKVKVSYYGQKGILLGSAMLYVTSVGISIDADVNRTGAVTCYAAGKDTWTWGPNGKGAILLVNCDRDRDDSGGMDSEDGGVPNSADLKDMSPMILTADAPSDFFDDHRIMLHIAAGDSDKLRVYCKEKWRYRHVLGGGKLLYEVDQYNRDEILFFVEGLQFPDVDFSGLVYINLTIQSILNKTDIFTEKLAFRIAPWIMTPNTQKPLEVYICSVPDNQDFLKNIKALVKKARCDLTVCNEIKNRGDRWIQDELEFGYTQAPHKQFPVVFDSPRDRGLANFPFKDILGPDFGYVTKEAKESEIGTLDSFGNLEVSPPVTVDGKEYPLGRILFGSGLPGSDVKMHQVLRDFLTAQKVQAPVELYSYWLFVGHIDEFMTFVPAPGPKGFRLLLASPRLCMDLFKQKQKEGYGKAVMFDGLNTDEQIDRLSIDEILSNDRFLEDSDSTQECIDMNRNILKKELGLTEDDIIDIPILYTIQQVANSYFPNMVNMLVLGKYLAIPKPFGPLINSKCCLEEKVESLLKPLGLNCVFINDFDTYHVNYGDIHCGTNVLRKPFTKKWWETNP
ncbi:protein-arginine deiminase type-1-like [Pelodytes ibericus]